MNIDEIIANVEERIEVIESKLSKLCVNNMIEEKPKKKRVPKVKTEDIPKKKRAPSGYILFCKATREDAKKKLKEELELSDDDKVPTTDVMRKLGMLWKKLSIEEQIEWKPKDTSDEE